MDEVQQAVGGGQWNGEEKLTLIHRVIIPAADYPKEYAILVTDRRSIFVRQPKTRGAFWLRREMRWGTALVTDVEPKTLQDFDHADLDALSSDPANFAIPHEAQLSFAMKADNPTFRPHEFWVKWAMQRQKEIFQVYNFEIAYRSASGTSIIRFYAVPLGAYFKPRRKTQTRETILADYAEDILRIYRKILSSDVVHSLTD